MSKSFDEIRRQKKPNEVSIELLLDPERSRAIDELERRYEQQKRRDSKVNEAPLAPGILKEIEQLRDEIEADKAVFMFRDPGRKEFETLLEKHPPDKEEKESGLSWSADGFIPALLSLTAIDPKLSAIEAKEIYDEWGRGDVEALFDAALQVCLEQASIPFTKRDIEGIMASVQNSTTQPNGESPTGSS